MMESRCKEQLRKREQARARRASETPEQREERLDVLVRHRHQKGGKPGCNRCKLMEEDMLVRHMKRGSQFAADIR